MGTRRMETGRTDASRIGRRSPRPSGRASPSPTARVLARGMARPSPSPSAYDGLAEHARRQLAAWRASEPELRAGSPEGVHDARVALRRLHSSLAQLRGVLARGERQRLGRELRWLARRLGRARDLDVLGAELRRARPPASLAPFLARLEAERADQQARILRTLESTRAKKLLARLEARFAGTPAQRRSGRRAHAPFARVLARRLARRLRRVRERAVALDADSRPDALHRLRIEAKKLRYLLECAEGLAPRDEQRHALRLLKDLQTALGAIQDAEVQRAYLRRRRSEEASADAHESLDGLEVRLALRRGAARERLPVPLAAFLAPAGRSAFEACLAELEARGEEPTDGR